MQLAETHRCPACDADIGERCVDIRARRQGRYITIKKPHGARAALLTRRRDMLALLHRRHPTAGYDRMDPLDVPTRELVRALRAER
jgi:hypothetical protein